MSDCCPPETDMRQECLGIINTLNQVSKGYWAEYYVMSHMRFWRKYCMGMIFSTIHGTEFFDNIIKCLDGAKWEPDKDEPVPGEYEENFRKFIKHYKKQYEQKH